MTILSPDSSNKNPAIINDKFDRIGALIAGALVYEELVKPTKYGNEQLMTTRVVADLLRFLFRDGEGNEQTLLALFIDQVEHALDDDSLLDDDTPDDTSAAPAAPAPRTKANTEDLVAWFKAECSYESAPVVSKVPNAPDVEHVCPVCYKRFMTKAFTNQVYCSNKCRNTSKRRKLAIQSQGE